MKRCHLQLSDSMLSSESEMPRNKKAKGLLHASEGQAGDQRHHPDANLAQSDVDQHGDNHGPFESNTCSIEHQLEDNDVHRAASRHTMSDFACPFYSTHHLHNMLRRLNSISIALLPDGGKKVVAHCQQIRAELHRRQAASQQRQQGTSVHVQDLAPHRDPAEQAECQPGRSVGMPSSSTPGDIRSVKVPTACENPQRGCKQIHLRMAPTNAWQAISLAQPASAQVSVQAADQPTKPCKDVEAEMCQDTGPGKEDDSARQACASDIAAPFVQPTMAVSCAQQHVLPGLICHFAATKGLSWLFCGKS